MEEKDLAIETLTKLNYSLWQEQEFWFDKNTGRCVGSINKLDTSRILDDVEVDSIFLFVKTHKLLTQMFCCNMFGGYGIDIFEHELYPGAEPNHLLRLTEDHLPKIKDEKKKSGEGRKCAWDLFSKFTHSKENIEWLKYYKMELPHDRSFYDY